MARRQLRVGDSRDSAKIREDVEAFIERCRLPDEALPLEDRKERVVEVQPAACLPNNVEERSDQPLGLCRNPPDDARFGPPAHDREGC